MNNILSKEELLLCNNHLEIIKKVLTTIQRKRNHLWEKIEKLSCKKSFLQKNFAFLGEKIINFLIYKRNDKLYEIMWELREPERKILESAELYEKVIIFFQDERTTVENISKVLMTLSQYLTNFSLKISAELFEMKCNIDDRNGRPIRPIDQATLSFLKALTLIRT